MFTINNGPEQRIPIKVWLENPDQIEASCMQQAKNLANLPFAFKWIALMPDTHAGYGMPIGGVIAAENNIIPNAVGVDIGCGMAFVQTNIPVEYLINIETNNGKLGQSIVGNIMRSIPTGFEHHKMRQQCKSAERFSQSLSEIQNNGLANDLRIELENAHFQVGTLGGGNHFIELQVNEQGLLGIMVHSGSRNVGYMVGHFFNNKAKELNEKQKTSVPAVWDLAYLPVDSDVGREYIQWMNFAIDFAKENREKIMDTVIKIVSDQVEKYSGFTRLALTEKINCHHNYAALEKHYGNMVWIHRKGAIRAAEGDLGIIPGAMGSPSYLVKGKGNPESFFSCSHGAGRQMSRHMAKDKFSIEDTILDLKTLGVFLGKSKKRDIGEESRFAYKNIDMVISNETDLIEIKGKLRAIAVIKG